MLDSKQDGKKDKCPICGEEKWKRSKLCLECSYKEKQKLEKPIRIVLKEDIRNFSFMELSRKYNVSDNTIRKWCKYYNLPFKKTEINKISDKDWVKI